MSENYESWNSESESAFDSGKEAKVQRQLTIAIVAALAIIAWGIFFGMALNSKNVSRMDSAIEQLAQPSESFLPFK